MKHQPYDLIGDIHGQHDKLTALLHHLDYKPLNGTFRHPDGRKVIFLGDYIDRGPKIRETLHLVRGMVEAGDAQAIMGNHEFNAIAYATPDGNGGHLRPHVEKNVHQHGGTLSQFADHQDEWTDWLAWMKRLPMFLDLGALRAVHACWDTERLPILAGQPLTQDAFLHACANKTTAEFLAIENVLKGPELHLPQGVFFVDKEGCKRTEIRARWWDLTEGITLGAIVMPEPIGLNHPLSPEDHRSLPNYPAAAPPVFMGHYWMPPLAPKAPLAPNIACLDYSGAFGDNPIVAYRWDGEKELIASKFTHTIPTQSNP